MQKTLRVGPVGDVYAWFYIIDGVIIDQGWELDPKEANKRGHEAIATWNKEHQNDRTKVDE